VSCDVVSQDSRPIIELIDFVRPYVSGVIKTAIEFNLRASLIEFARRSGVMHRVVRIQLQEGMKDYPIVLDDCLQPVRVRSVCYGGITTFVPRESPPCCTCGCYSFYFQDPSCISIGRSPSFSQEENLEELSIHMEVAPTQGTCSISSEVYNLWGETISYGAVARLLLIQNESFSNAELSTYFDRKFKEGVKKARADVNSGYTRSTKMNFGPRIVFRRR